MQDYEQTYEEHWKDLIEPDGRIDMDALKRELHDYWVAIENVGEVYCHITGSRISKPNTLAGLVIEEADAHYERIHNNVTDTSNEPPAPNRASKARIIDILLDENIYEIHDLVNDGHGVDIRILPGEGASSSYLLWKPIGENVTTDEVSITEYRPDMDLPDAIRQTWMLGNSVLALCEFISTFQVKPVGLESTSRVATPHHGSWQPETAIQWTPRAKKMLSLARKVAIDFGQEHVGTEHLLAGIIREKEGFAARALAAHGLTMEWLVNECGWRSLADRIEERERVEYERLRAKFEKS